MLRGMENDPFNFGADDTRNGRLGEQTLAAILERVLASIVIRLRQRAAQFGVGGQHCAA